MNVILIMRQVYYKFSDHINALRNLNVDIHLITEVECAKDDALFTSVKVIPYASTHQQIINVAEELVKKYEIKVVLTFLEAEIILSSEIAEHLNLPGLEKIPAIISRDKNKQRNLLKENSVPSPSYFQISELDDDFSCFDNQYPLIVKPTQASLSYGVFLVKNQVELKNRLKEINEFSKSNHLHFHETKNKAFALVETFLPGDEITLDAVVINGKFILGGIHNKWRNMGPTFEEDVYSLPFKKPQFINKLTEIAKSICEALRLKNSLFNVEMRQDKEGNFRVVEFSSRISGGFCYRHIKYVYGIDLVTLYCKSLLSLPIEPRELIPRLPTMTTCTKWVFGTGKVLKNETGKVRLSVNYEDYYPLANPGVVLKGMPHDLGCIGRLSLYAPFHSLEDVLALEEKSYELIKKLDVELLPLPSSDISS